MHEAVNREYQALLKSVRESRKRICESKGCGAKFDPEEDVPTPFTKPGICHNCELLACNEIGDNLQRDMLPRPELGDHLTR